MSCTACKCNVSLSNTGTGCTPLIKVAKVPIMVPIYANDGTMNGIPFSATINQAYFDALVNNTDPSKRWYPIPEVKDVKDVRAANIMEKFPDLSEVFIMEAIRTFDGIIIGSAGTGAASPQLKGKIEAARCAPVGFYFVDKDGNLIGKISSDGLSLQPIQIQEQSLACMFVKYTDTTIQKLQLTFDYSTFELDEDLRMISCNEIGDADLLHLRGLLNVCSKATSITHTGFIVELDTEYGTPISPLTDKGLVKADFTLYYDTQKTTITITTVTESTVTPGVYTFVIPSQNSLDSLTLTPSKNGRDYTCVVATKIVIPQT